MTTSRSCLFRYGFYLLLTLLSVTVLGCASTDSENPVTPSIPSETVTQKVEVSGNRIPWGVWAFRVDPDLGEISAEPLRGAQFHLNAVKLLEDNPCTDCLTIGNFDFTTPGQISLDVTLRHPYPGNLNVTAFDVRGIFITDANYKTEMPFPNPLEFAWGSGLPILLEPDGYTNCFNPTDYPYDAGEPAISNYYPGNFANSTQLGADFNPFMAYGKSNPRRMFLPGTEETITYKIRVPDDPFEFGYVVDACWTPPGKVVIDPENDFPIEANCLEPYAITVVAEEGLEDKVNLSTAKIWVELALHSPPSVLNSQTVQVPIDPLPNYWDAAFQESSVTSEGNYLFEYEIRNIWKLPAGDWPLVVSRDDGSNKPVYGMVSTISIGPASDWTPLAYALDYPSLQVVDVPILFRDDGSWDPDGGDIQKYEWDFDNDGSWDAEGYEVHHAFSTPGDHEIVLRVTDDEGTSGILDEPLLVHVKSNPGWARTWGGDLTSYATGIATDSQGNIYVCGDSGDDYDPGPDVYDPPDPTGSFLAKYDSDGNFLWAEQWGFWVQFQSCYPYGICIDSGDNIYVCGTFEGTVDFDPGPGQYIVSSAGFDCFLVKFDSDGQFIYAKTWLGPSSDEATGLAFSPTGIIAVTGGFSFSVDFDLGPGTSYLYSNGGVDSFIALYDTDWNFINAKSWGGSQTGVYDDDLGLAVAFDASDSIFVAGHFKNSCDFDPGPGEDIHDSYTYNFRDAYVSKFDSDLNFQWAWTWGGEHDDEARSLAVEEDSDVLVVSAFIDTVDLDPGPGEAIYTSDKPSTCLSRFDSDGTLQDLSVWACDHCGKFDAYGVGLGGDGSIYLGGSYGAGNNGMDIDPGPGEYIITNTGDWVAFLLKLSSNGSLQWTSNWGDGEDGGDQRDATYGLAISTDGSIYTAGQFTGLVDFDPGVDFDYHESGDFGNRISPFLSKFPPNGQW